MIKNIKSKLKDTNILSVLGLIVISIILLVTAYSQVINPLDLNPTIIANDTIIKDGNLIFTTKPDGTIKPSIINGKNDISIGFAITGKVNGINALVTTEDYNWTWNKVSYNVTRKKLNMTKLNEFEIKNPRATEVTDAVFDNVTFVITNLTGTNNNSQLVWEQQWTYDPEGEPKLKHTITNNIGKDITNATFWFVFKLPENFNVKFNNLNYKLNRTGDIRIRNTGQLNLSRILPIIDLKDVEFRYIDLLQNNFVISDFYVGNGSIIGHPETLIVGIGVSKGNGILTNGETIILDPEVTDWKSPTRTGMFYDEWTDGSYVMVSDTDYARADSNGLFEGTDLYGFDSIPADAQVVGIEIRVQGRLDPPA